MNVTMLYEIIIKTKGNQFERLEILKSDVQ